MSQGTAALSMVGPLPLEFNNIDMWVTFEPQPPTVHYRPVVAHGQVWKAHLKLVDGNEVFMCDEVDALQDGIPWFTTGRVNEISVTKNGVICTITNFDDKGMLLQFQNNNDTTNAIVVSMTPKFFDGLRRWPGKDPQIVLPPEK